MAKLIYRNVRCCLGMFTPSVGVNINGDIEYSDKDFTEYSDDELESFYGIYEGTLSLDAKAFYLEIAERKLAKWQHTNF